MSKERRRSIKTAQVGLRELNFYFDGSVASPVPAGFDQFQISSISKLQTGQYTVVFSGPFERACRAHGWVMGDENRYVVIESAAYDRVTLSIRRRDTQARVDDTVDLRVMGSDHRFDY